MDNNIEEQYEFHNDYENEQSSEEANMRLELVPGGKEFMTLYNFNHLKVAESLKTLLKNGDLDPIQAYISLRRMKGLIEATIEGDKADKEMKEFFKEQVDKVLEGGKTYKIYGASLSIRPTGVRYDFSNCGDSYLNELYNIQERVKELIKQREELIKTMLPPDDTKTLGIRTKKIVQEGMPSFSISNDEFEETINPAVKLAGSSVFVSFDKEK